MPPDLLDFSITSTRNADKRTVTITMRHNNRDVAHSTDVKISGFDPLRIPDVLIQLLKGYEQKFMAELANNPIPRDLLPAVAARA